MVIDSICCQATGTCSNELGLKYSFFDLDSSKKYRLCKCDDYYLQIYYQILYEKKPTEIASQVQNFKMDDYKIAKMILEEKEPECLKFSKKGNYLQRCNLAQLEVLKESLKKPK